jgi:hypothetical protein
MSAKELKAHFPKAHREHQTLKRKTRSKASWDQLHPAFERFPDFLRHLGPAPHPDSSIDRFDIDNPVYGPGTCQWASPQNQARRRSTTTWITWHGERRSLAEWADLSGISYETLKKRHERHWTEERMFKDAPVRRYRSPRLPLVPPPPPTPIGTYTYNVGETPIMPDQGWPEGFIYARQFDHGYLHAQAVARKNKITPLSRAHFSAWVVGCRLRELRRQIDAAGLSGYVIPAGRDRIPLEDIADIDRKACACAAIREYYNLVRFERCFVSAYLAEVQAQNDRSAHPQAMWRQIAEHGLRSLVKQKHCSSPNEAYKVYKK